MSLFFKQEDEEEDEEDDFIPDEIARDLEEDKKTDEDFSEGLDPLQDRSRQTEIEQAAEELRNDMAKKRRRKPARDIRVLNQYLQDIKNIKENGTFENGIYDSMSRNTFKKISKENINIIFDKMVFLQMRRSLLMEQPYEEFITNGKFLIGEGETSKSIDVKMLQREYTELGSDKDFLNFLQGLYSRRFNGQIPPSLVDKAKSRQQYNRLISSIVIGDTTGGIVRQREILEDMRKSVNRSVFAFTELEKAKEVLTKHIDDLETLVDKDLEILIDRRLKALTLAYSTVQRKVAEYVTERLVDIPDDTDRSFQSYRGVSGGKQITPSLDELIEQVEQELSLTYNQFKAEGEKKKEKRLKELKVSYSRNKKNADNTEKDEDGKTELDRVTEKYNEDEAFANKYFSNFTSKRQYNKKMKTLQNRLKELEQSVKDSAEDKELQSRISADIDERRRKEGAGLDRYKKDTKRRRLKKSDSRRQLVEEAQGKVRVKLGDTSRRLTQQQIKDMLDDLKSAQPEILEEAKEDIRKEIESQLEIEKKRLSEIESRLKTVDKYKPLIRESSSLVGEYTGDKEIFEEQVVLGNKVKLAAQGLREIEGIMRQLNKENEQSLEEWIDGAEKSVVIDLNKFGKLGAGIGDTTPKEVRLVGELVERVNTRFDSLQEQINIVKNKLENRK